MRFKCIDGNFDVFDVCWGGSKVLYFYDVARVVVFYYGCNIKFPSFQHKISTKLGIP